MYVYVYVYVYIWFVLLIGNHDDFGMHKIEREGAGTNKTGR